MAPLHATTTMQASQQPRGQQAPANPFANDYTLMNLSLWWVQCTRPFSTDFNQDVAATMASLARDLR